MKKVVDKAKWICYYNLAVAKTTTKQIQVAKQLTQLWTNSEEIKANEVRMDLDNWTVNKPWKILKRTKFVYEILSVKETDANIFEYFKDLKTVNSVVTEWKPDLSGKIKF